MTPFEQQVAEHLSGFGIYGPDGRLDLADLACRVAAAIEAAITQARYTEADPQHGFPVLTDREDAVMAALAALRGKP